MGAAVSDNAADWDNWAAREQERLEAPAKPGNPLLAQVIAWEAEWLASGSKSHWGDGIVWGHARIIATRLFEVIPAWPARTAAPEPAPAAPDNPPAFPIACPDQFQFANNGMDLLDHFAGCALQGLLADGDLRADPETFAQSAYHVAEAMLAERAKRKAAA